MCRQVSDAQMPISWLASIDDLNDRRPSGTSRGPEKEEIGSTFSDGKQAFILRTKLEWGIGSKGSTTNIKYFYLSWTVERSKKLRKHY
jgi:hypothetical protein